MRLAVSGAGTVRFNVRAFSGTDEGLVGFLAAGRAGSAPATMTFSLGRLSPARDVSIPTSGTASEVVLSVAVSNAPCTPDHSPAGWIIDDLRVE